MKISLVFLLLLSGCYTKQELDHYSNSSYNIGYENGKMEAEEGCHDDTVMALAICNHVHVGRFTPVTVTDEYYSEAI